MSALNDNPAGLISDMLPHVAKVPAMACDEPMLDMLATLRESDHAAFAAQLSRVASAARMRTTDLEREVSRHSSSKASPHTRTTSASALLCREFQPIQFIVPGLLPEGLMVLAARPKVGKSWLALDLALAVATGGQVLGRPAQQGDALYLALEDNDRRMQSRLLMLGADALDLSRLHYATDWPRGENGAIAIQEWIDAHPATRLVVIDVFAKLREPTYSRDNAYNGDYAAVAMLKPQRPGVAILLVHHTRKQTSEDPLDDISGTLGIGGAADGALILKRSRGKEEAEVHVIGRDLAEEGEYAVKFDREACRWQWLGEAWQIRISAERRQVLDLLAVNPMRPAELAKELGKTANAVRVMLHRMVDDGLVDQGLDGRYRVIGGEHA